MFNKINYLSEKDINKTPIENIKTVLNNKDDYMSHILYLINNELSIEEKEQIMDKLKELRKKENMKYKIAIKNMSNK